MTTWYYYNPCSLKKILSVFLWVILCSGPAVAAMRPGDIAPVFTLSTQSGEPVSLPRNGNMILSFFASWCQPCRDELPLLDSVVEELEKKGIAVVIVGVKEDYPKIGTLLNELNVKKPVVLSDRDGKVAAQYQVRFLPTTFFVGRDGMVKDIIFGEIASEAELRSSVKKLR